MGPDSLVTGLYGSRLKFDTSDPFLDSGAYGEPDLRNLVAM